jgi:hypothetical protein
MPGGAAIDCMKHRRRAGPRRMTLLFDFDLQKRVCRPDFKNQPETARCLFDFCEER